MGIFYVKPEDARAFSASFKKALAELNREVVEVYRGFALNALHFVVRETPQWSGGAASNWNFDWNYASLRVDTDLKRTAAEDIVGTLTGTNVRDKSDRRAWEVSFARASVTVAGLDALATDPKGALKLPDLYINNAAKELDGESYIQHLEENTNDYLRPENEPGHMVHYVVQSVNGLGGGILNGYVGPLSRIKLGAVEANLV